MATACVLYSVHECFFTAKVLKVGTSSLLHPELGTVRLSMLAQLSEEVMRLRKAGGGLDPLNTQNLCPCLVHEFQQSRISGIDNLSW